MQVTGANASHQHCAPNLRARISSRTAEYRKQFQIQLKSCIFIVTTFLLLSLLYADVKELQAVCLLAAHTPRGKSWLVPSPLLEAASLTCTALIFTLSEFYSERI